MMTMSYEQTIYNVFRRNGLTEAGALGFLGNWACESGCEPYRLQGDFSPYRTTSHIYVQNVTNGSISKQQFQNDQKGFGLAQWTYWSRKAALYDYWRASGKALDSAEMQTDFALQELRSDYKALLDFLKSTNDIFTATSRICREYERPAVNNIDARFQAASRIKHEIDLDHWDDDDPQPEPEPVKDHSLKLRTIDKNCEGWDETLLLKGLLLCRNYEGVLEDLWGAVKQFQEDFGLYPVDGVVGPKTWNKLLERE